MLTTSSENVEAALCKLAITEDGIPYGCSRLPKGIENPGGLKACLEHFQSVGSMRRPLRPNVSQNRFNMGNRMRRHRTCHRCNRFRHVHYGRVRPYRRRREWYIAG